MTSDLEEIEAALRELTEFYDHYGHSPSNLYTYKQALVKLQKLREIMVPDLQPEIDQFHFSSGVHKDVYMCALALAEFVGER